jgi:hypothetical protein
MASTNSFVIGENVMIVASNRPWVDMSIPFESNDFRDVDYAFVTIYGPCGNLLLESEMCPMTDNIGHYYINYQTNEECNRVGLHKVVIEMRCTDYPSCSAETVCSTSSSGTSGTPFIATKKIDHFRLISGDV